ncbi:MAG: SGNH/GDSL hydrolase family protein [Bacteroidales bacterium]|nr:SGNH/GDSL hydrolase family protein [Bacteroidales bacterium]
MKSGFRIVIIMVVVTALLSAYSFAKPKITICGEDLKKSKIAEFAIGDTLPLFIEGVYTSEYKPRVGIDSSKQKILLIGDSMLEQFRWRLRDYCKENGHEMASVIWYSSQTEWYGTTDTLKYFINKEQPTYIILILGANELFVKDIIKIRTPYVKHILEQIGDIPYIWVGPPNWRDDTGINEMILANVGSRRYFPSKNLTYKRYADGAHPKPESAFMWADSVASFIMNKSRYPILLNTPSQKYSGSPNSTILQPWKK